MAEPQQRNRGPRRDRNTEAADKSGLVEKVVFINRCAKVVKGGRRFSFSALIITGDKKGKVGLGFGKANEVSEAIRKASDSAKKQLTKFAIHENTIPHEALGESSGHGKASGKGHKGQKARSGGSIRLGFEGGQMPLIRRLPKRGFNNNQFKKSIAVVNLRDLNEKFENGATVDEKALREAGLV